MATRRTKSALGVGIPVVIVLLVVAAWAVDTRAASGKVPRNVRLAGGDVSRMPERELAASVHDVAQQYATTEVEVATPGRSYKVPASRLGLSLDENATVRAALDIGKDDATAVRPLTWLSSFVEHRSAPLRFHVRDDVLRRGLESLGGPGGGTAKEPTIVASAARIDIISGSSGLRIDPSTVGRDLLRRATSGEMPIIVQAKALEEPPRVTDAAARAFAADVTQKTSRPLVVDVGGRPVQLPPATLRSWLGSKVGTHGLELTLDGAKPVAALKGAAPDITAGRNASFAVDGPTVTIVPSEKGAHCCAPGTTARLLAAIRRGAAKVDVALAKETPTFTTDDAVKLGIKEPVGTVTTWKDQPQVKSFTTYYEPGLPRVVNIHHMADAVRGAIIKPGETFSLNGRVGKRTVEKGYVTAPVIVNGQHAEDVGGGVSQFSTTLFNAAFFAGLDLVSYQSHSIHFARYPYGREATLGFPAPDQKIRNSTPYGVLIWTSYTDTSVTVTLYSTQNVFGEQTGQTESKVGPCTRVRTTRVRTYADGRTTTDSVGSLYRPAEGVKC